MFLLINISRVGISKSTVLVIIFRVFMGRLSMINTGPIIIIHLQCLKIVYQKIKRAYYKGTMNNGTPSSSSDYEMSSKIGIFFVKNYHA